MGKVKIAGSVAVILAVLLGLTPFALGGGASGQLACCVVTSPAGATQLKGTAAIVYSPAVLSYENSKPKVEEPAYIDVKLRLERGGKYAFFELHLKEDIFGLDNFEITCLILNPNEPKPTDDLNSEAAVRELVNRILTTFFPGSGLDADNTWLVITRKSIELTDGSAGSEIPGTDRIAAMGDVVVYVVDPAQARLEYNPQCPR